LIAGVTTNPTLLLKSGVTDYLSFANNILKIIKSKPISLEVLSDDFEQMEQQALVLNSLASNIFVKIPICNSVGKSSVNLVKKLVDKKVRLNITAILDIEQVENISRYLDPEVPSYVSVFAGRVADTGVDPLPLMKESIVILKKTCRSKLIWASPREVFNFYQANSIGCNVITMPKDMIEKLKLRGKDLIEYSTETSKMFFDDGKKSGLFL
jgi:transaldolase